MSKTTQKKPHVKHEWSKFTWQDWLGDVGLRMCSAPARALWMDMLAMAHAGHPPGHLAKNGQAYQVPEIARVFGASEDETARLLAELEGRRVFSRTANGVIFSRRMVRDIKIFRQQSAWGSTGGNPNITSNNQRKNKKGSLNPPIKATLKIESEEESEGEQDSFTPRVAPGRVARVTRQRGTRLPDDWQPCDQDLQYAADLGLSAARTAEDFRGYWLAKAGKDAVKLDWSLTWQGWCRREAERRGTNRAAPSDAPPPPPRFL